MQNIWKMLFVIIAISEMVSPSFAHHIMGRPSYALNEDSNTPPALQIETFIGDYDINYMIYPAFPRPGEGGRINLYVKHSDTGQSYTGKVSFTVRDDSWLSMFGVESPSEKLGVQVIDDYVYRQGFLFSENGEYIITARFEADGEPYIIDFPLRVGAASPWGPISITVALIAVLLAGISIVQRRRSMTEKIRQAHAEKK